MLMDLYVQKRSQLEHPFSKQQYLAYNPIDYNFYFLQIFIFHRCTYLFLFMFAKEPPTDKADQNYCYN